MPIQSILNEDAMSYVPRIRKLIEEAERFEANQMKEKALQMMSTISPCLQDMNILQIAEFETNLIETFKYKNWI